MIFKNFNTFNPSPHPKEIEHLARGLRLPPFELARVGDKIGRDWGNQSIVCVKWADRTCLRLIRDSQADRSTGQDGSPRLVLALLEDGWLIFHVPGPTKQSLYKRKWERKFEVDGIGPPSLTCSSSTAITVTVTTRSTTMAALPSPSTSRHGAMS